MCRWGRGQEAAWGFGGGQLDGPTAAPGRPSWPERAGEQVGAAGPGAWPCAA